MNDPASSSRFRTTQWTRVLSARGASGEAREAMGDLCRDYYAPVVTFLAREGRPVDAAREVAHEFFAHLLGSDPLARVERGRGRFRSYLLGALKHFLSHQREREGRVKHGGSASHVSLEDGTDSSPGLAFVLADQSALSPDACYDRQWALTVLARALEAMRAKAESEGKGEQFARLKPWLTGETEYGDQREIAAELEMTASAVKVAVHRLRQQFRRSVRTEVGRTLDDPAAAEEEMQALLSALG